VAGAELGHVDCAHAGHTKRVRFFALAGACELGPLPERTRERRWVDRAALVDLPFVSDEAHAIALGSLAR
jgi:hypothetical protein